MYYTVILVILQFFYDLICHLFAKDGFNNGRTSLKKSDECIHFA